MKLLLTAAMFLLLPLGKNQYNTQDISTNEHLVLATVWHQVSPEYKALCLQTYEMAKLRLLLNHNQGYMKQQDAQSSKPAIVLDIDETVLDNSPFEAFTVLMNIDYPAGWDEWCNKAEAAAVPGAIDFLQCADSLGYHIFYISNRKDHLKEVTIKNMQELGIPQVTPDHLLLRDKTSSKVARRNIVEKEFDIVMLLGDNLNDFHGDFEVGDNSARMKIFETYRHEFGKKFIVLPNAMYGVWENNLYSDGTIDKVKARHEALTGF